MSGFAVLLDFERPVDPARLSAVSRSLATRGPHRQSRAVSGTCGLAHSALWTTVEAETERQPLRHPARDMWVVADARIDNGADLRRLLRPSWSSLATDAELILAAYEEWGTDAPDHLVGDFGFAVWDGEQRRLLVARDHVGVRPVFFHRAPGGVVVASSASGVLAGTGEPTTVDEGYLAGYLAEQPPSDSSLWTGHERLPAGHALVVSRGACRIHRWWNPSLEPVDHPFGDTVERVREVFDEAVRGCLRTRDAVSCDVSGGFDSSTVAATATALGASPHALAIAFRGDPAADETKYQQAVARHLGLALEVIEAEDVATIDPRAFARERRMPLYAVDAADTAAKHDLVSQRGCTVSLSGDGGDEAFLGEDTAVLDLAASGEFAAALRLSDANGLARVDAMRWIVGSLTREWVVGVAIRGQRRWPESTADRTLARARTLRSARRTPWLTVVPSAPAVHRALRAPGVPRAAWARSSNYLDSPWSPPAYELTDTLASERGVEVRYPFLDRRLVELCLRLPESQVRWEGARRGLHRAAFGAMLPDALASRTDKANLARPYMRKLLRTVGRDDAVALLYALGDRVRPAPLLAAYDRGLDAFSPPPGQPSGFPLWAALSAGAAIVDR